MLCVTKVSGTGRKWRRQGAKQHHQNYFHAWRPESEFEKLCSVSQQQFFFVGVTPTSCTTLDSAGELHCFCPQNPSCATGNTPHSTQYSLHRLSVFSQISNYVRRCCKPRSLRRANGVKQRALKRKDVWNSARLNVRRKWFCFKMFIQRTLLRKTWNVDILW